jgi:hypothetical protein
MFCHSSTRDFLLKVCSAKTPIAKEFELVWQEIRRCLGIICLDCLQAGLQRGRSDTCMAMLGFDTDDVLPEYAVDRAVGHVADYADDHTRPFDSACWAEVLHRPE